MRNVTGPQPDPRAQLWRCALLVLLAFPLPGLALWLAGRRRAGAAALAATAAAVLTLAVLWGQHRPEQLAVRLGSRPDLLESAALVVVALGTAWLSAIVGTASAAWPATATRGEKLGAMTLVVALSLAVAGPTALVARYALISRALATQVFASGVGVRADGLQVPEPRRQPHVDPWAGTPRLNVLLLGLDSAAGRVGVRPDSIVLASVDTRTGATVLFGLPRNLEKVPFPRSSPLHRLWPHGFDCGSECLLNAVWTEAVNHAGLFPGDPSPGLTATRSAVEAVLGLPVDYTVTVSLRGFMELVDAVGGVEVNVRTTLPIGGAHDGAGRVTEAPRGYIEPGRQHLDGYHALWFSRSRFASNDFDRMRRQRCMIGALVAQVDPMTFLARFPAIAAATGRNLHTDIPLSDLPAWATIAERVRAGSLTSLPLTDAVVHPDRPDFNRIRTLVRAALAIRPGPAAATAPTSGTASSSPPPSTRQGPSTAQRPTVRPPGHQRATAPQRLADAC
ncbi:LCP family protein [Pedococcus sp. 5OH_020]|uniref:LCP family protein n=1 Tax=Pedococcus sp. 5OH_020 TaxID=2989814 RepID=UPI0022E9975A|nr:LCP family protein [Pedococcus sp. 5OH_020]